MSNKGEPTIHDIARQLNISASTVSRALKDNPRISRKTREKIKATALEMGYQPNIMASNLRNKKSNTIGIVVPLINRHFFSSVISGVEDVAFSSGYNVVISQSNDNLEKEEVIVQSMFSNRIDGLIISIGMQTRSFSHINLFKKKNIPLVFFDRIINEIEADKIVVDDYAGGFKVTQHLIDQGCRRIAHIAGPKNLIIYQERLRGYNDALQKNNYPFDQSLVVSSNLTSQEGIETIKKLLAQKNPPDGIFCGNDTTALSVLNYLKENQIRVPEDIAIVGFSNEPFSAVVSPPISTIAQPGYEMGQTAAKLLIDQIESESNSGYRTITMPTELIIRKSSVKNA